MSKAVARIGREALLDEQLFLERSIEDLGRELAAGDVSAADYERLRAAYAARASEVAAALEAQALERKPGMRSLGAEESDRRTDPDRGGEGGRTQWRRLRRSLGRRRAAIGWAALCCFAAAAVLLALGLGGVVPFASSKGSPTLSVAARIRTELAEAAALAENHNVLEAVAVYDQVLALDPHQPEALAEGGWLTRLAGLSTRRAVVVKGGDREIAEAVAVSPGLAVPRAYDGVALFEDERRPAAAVRQFVAMLADHPSATLLSSVRRVAIAAFDAAGASVPVGLRRATPGS